MRLLSWNVNGLRAVAGKGFPAWLERSRAAIVGLQETRARPEQVPATLDGFAGWHVAWAVAERPGYSGVLLLSREEPDAVQVGLGEERFDREGRFVMARFGRLVVGSVYVPNGSGRERDNGRVPFKLAFSRALHERLARERARGRRVIVMGDFNTAHREIDLARPAANRTTSGFLPEERREMDRWLASGWTDAFRRFESGPGHYTWWSQRQGARARNVGWRIDYALASRAARPWLRRAFHQPEVPGSDHCPVGLDLEPGVCSGGRSRR